MLLKVAKAHVTYGFRLNSRPFPPLLLILLMKVPVRIIFHTTSIGLWRGLEGFFSSL